MAEFVHLHLHSDRSQLDSIIQIPKLIPLCREQGMRAVAITDHGVVSAAIRLYEEARKEKDKDDNPVAPIKPIIGCELYLAPTDDHTLREPLEGHPPQQCYHLTALAKNAAGVSQLYQLSSLGYLEGYYYKPRVSIKQIEEIGKDLILLGACAKGPVSWSLRNDNRAQAGEYLARLRDSFKDRFYLELMYHGLRFQEVLNEELLEMSRLYEVPWIPTNDAHFLSREDHYEHSLMMCLQLKKTLPELDEAKMRYPTECYVKSPEEMESYWGEDACRRTLEIAEQVDITLELDKQRFPLYSEPDI